MNGLDLSCLLLIVDTNRLLIFEKDPRRKTAMPRSQFGRNWLRVACLASKLARVANLGPPRLICCRFQLSVLVASSVFLSLLKVQKDAPRCADQFGTGFIENGFNNVEL